MEIDGEVNIEIDQYAPVNLEIDVGTLAEELCQSYDLVDDVRMGEYFHSHVEDMVQDETGSIRLDMTTEMSELRVQNVQLGHDLMTERVQRVTDHEELREQVKELQPNNNYVRINDLRDVIDAQIDLRVAGILNDVMKGIEQQR